MGRTTPNRPLTQNERDLVRWLLEHGSADADRFLPQIDRLTVVGQCDCGCPTVYFALDGEPITQNGVQLISEYLGMADGESVFVTLFETDGKICTLEVYPFADSGKPFGLPAIETLYSGDKPPNTDPNRKFS